MKNERFSSIWRKSAAGTVAFLTVFPILGPIASAMVADGAAENVLSGPNSWYVSLVNSGSYAPAFALSGSLDAGNSIFVEVLSWSAVAASSSYVSMSGGESSGSVVPMNLSALADGNYSLSGSVFSWSTVSASGMTGSVVKDTVRPSFVSTGTVSTATGTASFTGISVSDLHYVSSSLSYSGIANSLQTWTYSLSGAPSSLHLNLVGLGSWATYSYSLSAIDAAGNASTVSPAGTFSTPSYSSDTVSPVVAVGSHVNWQKVTGSSLLLTGSVTDSGTVASVTVNSASASISWNAWSKTVTGLASGTNSLSVLATDAAGNTGTASVNVVRVPAMTSGQFAVVSGSGTVSISFTTDVSWSGSVAYGTNSGSLGSVSTDSGSSVSHQIDLSGLSANTLYYYKTFGTSMGNSGALSPISTFRTPSSVDVATASWSVSVSGAAYFSGSTSTGATFAHSGTLTIASLNGFDSVSFPFGGATLLSSGAWDSSFQSPIQTSIAATWAIAGYVFTSPAYQIGSTVSELSLTGSRLATVTVRIGTQYAGQTIKVYRSTDGVSYAFLADCAITWAGDCVFQTNHFSLFAFAALSDGIPSQFAFADVTWAEPSALTVSAPATISGINVPVSVSVSGGEYSINGWAYVSASWTANLGDVVRLRVASSSVYGFSVTATFTAGNVSGTFRVVTKSAPSSSSSSSSGGGSSGGWSGGGGWGWIPTTPPVSPPVSTGSTVWPGGPQPTGESPPVSLFVRDLVFVDIAFSWAKTYIEKLAVRWIVNNVKYYRPEYALTRAEFLKIVGNSVGWQVGSTANPFDDVATNAWYAPYVAYAYNYGIISDADHFRPNDTITRAEVAKVLIGMLRREPSKSLFTSFSDVNPTHTLFAYIEAVRELGVFDGQAVGGFNIFRPNDPISRAEVAKVIVRALDF